MPDGCTAWGDESIQGQGTESSKYLLGVCICNSDEKEIRAGFHSKHLDKGSKAHWYDMNQKERKRSIELINDFDLQHIVVSAGPLGNSRNTERIRRKCFETLLPLLEQKYNVSRVVMEARSRKQDNREILFVQSLRQRKFISRLRFDFDAGQKDARLWVPDQVLGSLGSKDAFKSDVPSEICGIKNIDYTNIQLDE
ncbi:hypothetical protein [Bifidobacterium sp. ESL0790]|uniref:hypothetical protein n=1 Tax=Bifidobacterium sp. ESL0790 TaxID=2983233 RepID=UPI0023F952A5|nr:hypothetical protein [Bifidobacterium sp. ESL0790]WEV72359.1 hypothetical protein OZY47_08065 [Bifidobacterium sp. ESL0790]